MAYKLPADLGRYTLLELLGEGGMGRVYRGVLNGPAGFKKTVALKVLKTSTRGRDAQMGHEARVGGMLKHPNVVDHYDFGDDGGQLYIVMEYVEGASLSGLLEQGPLPAGAWRDLAGQLCAGLAHVHDLETSGRGLVHRDLKPANVLVDRAGLVKLADFGIALLGFGAVPDVVWGTPGYMSPEQIAREAIDARSDLFSLGAVLFEAATGERLLPGPVEERARRTLTIDGWLVRRKILDKADAAIPGLSGPLRACLWSEPEHRPDSAEAVWAMIRDLPIPHDDSALTLAAMAAGAVGAAPTPTPALSRRSSSQSRGRMPSEPEGFHGRRRELEALVDALHDARVVTLKGPGGSGKTRLALRAGRRLQSRFPGGVWWCELEEARTPVGIAVAVARGLGVQVPGDDTAAGQLVAALRGLGPALLVLDEVEHAAGEVARVLTAWLAEVPDLRFLVTTRTVLHLRGEHILDLGPLSRQAAVRLLEERAATRGADWKGDPAVPALADALDRLPLALELAAGRAGLLGPQQVLDRLRDRFKLLKGTQGTTLRAAIESSWEALEPWEQAALAQLSVFRGGLRLEAAEEVVDLSDWPDAPWVLDVVQRLWETSLLRSRTVRGQPRFAMLESVRAFALEQLSARGEERAARDRHAKAFIWYDEGHFAQSTRRIRLPDIALELDNLLAAFDHALQTGDADTVAHVTLATNHLVMHTSPLQRALARTERALAGEPSDLLRARLLASRGLLLQNLLRFAEAVSELDQAVALYQQMGEPWREGAALNNLGSCLRHLDRVDEALAAYHRALEISQRIGDPGLEGATEVNLAIEEVADRAASLARFRRAAQLRARLGPSRDWSIDATLHGNTAVLEMAIGDVVASKASFEYAWQLCQDHRLRLQGISVQLGLARIATLLQDEAGAEAAFAQADTLARPEGLGDRRAVIALERGWRALRVGTAAQARLFAKTALDELGPAGSVRRRWNAKALMGEAMVREGMSRQGEKLLDEAQAAFETLPDTEGERVALHVRRGLLALWQGDLEEARDRLAEARRGDSYDAFIVEDLATLARHLD